MESRSANAATPVPGRPTPSSGLSRHCMLVAYMHTFRRPRNFQHQQRVEVGADVNLSRQCSKAFPLSFWIAGLLPESAAHYENNLTDSPRGMSLNRSQIPSTWEWRPIVTPEKRECLDLLGGYEILSQN